MAKSRLRIVAPSTEKRTITPKRRPNADLRTREYLTDREVEMLAETAKTSRWGHRDATMILADKALVGGCGCVERSHSRRIHDGRFAGVRYCCGVKPSASNWRDHSAGASRSRAMLTPRGRRPSTAARTSLGARKASEIVMLT